MTDIKQAIQELREAAHAIADPNYTWVNNETGISWNHINNLRKALFALNRLESSVEGGTVDAELCTMCGNVLFPIHPEFGKGQHTTTVADEDGDPSPAPCGPTIPYPTPDLSAKISAAAEEIRDTWISLKDGDYTRQNIAAIIRRHIEGVK